MAPTPEQTTPERIEQIAEAVMNPSKDGEKVIREAVKEMGRMDDSERLLFLCSIRSAGLGFLNED
jgi:hypothetical protein